MSVTIREPGAQAQAQAEVGQDLYAFAPVVGAGAAVTVPGTAARASRTAGWILAQWEGNVRVPVSVVRSDTAGARRASA
ncbi:hypothetical protein Shyhy01_64200 [Streptomyces hygroscopicus subsp. hygroscopicus]|nr:hypothetical protein Shyhy01_64200 [Streptomyces hygroscopicus subsp. hygroscopicus]